jgi:hypothetical protein
LTHGAAAGEDAPEGILVVGVAVIEPARQFVEAIEAEQLLAVDEGRAASSAEAWVEEPKQVIPEGEEEALHRVAGG